MKVETKILHISKTILIFVMLQSSSINAYNLLHNKGMASREISKNNTSVLLGCSDSHPPFNYFKMLQPRKHNTVEITPVNNQDEIWKDISSYEGMYQISNIGNVKSLSRMMRTYGKTKYHLSKEKNLSLVTAGAGYKHIGLCKGGKCSIFTVHRLVAQAFVPNPNNLPCVNHIDGVKLNNNYMNLEWCTKAQNNQHALDIGLRTPFSGEGSCAAKLTDSLVLEIRASKLHRQHLAEIYKVSYSTIYAIQTRRTWSHI